MGKIAIVSDSIAILNSIQAKLVLLRQDDNVIKCDTSEIHKFATNADIVLFHTPEINDITLTTISSLKKENNVVILLVDTVNPKSLLDAYDLGISDFCSTSITNFELLIKIINAKKELKKNKTVERLKRQLCDKGVLKQNSEIYTQIADVVNANFYNEIHNSTILTINIGKNSQEDFILNNQEQQLCKMVRESDFVVNHTDFSYLIFLPNTELKNGAIVFEKLCQKLNLPLTGVLFNYKDETPKDLKSKIERLEIEREEKNLTLLIAETSDTEETENDWLSNNLTDDEPKNYKLFQNIYNTKTKKVIEPAFYRTKQKFEKNLANTKIKYFTDKNRAEFMLINFDNKNALQIIYKNSAKVGINIVYEGLNSPENETFELPFAKLTTRGLCEILENFIHKGEKNELIKQ